MRTARFVVFGAAVAALSCSSIAPVKVNVGEQCFRCRRSITDLNMASETIQGSFVSKYRAPGCMAKYIAAHPDEAIGKVFVTDYQTGTMIDPAVAFFVPVIVDDRTQEGDYRAYGDRAEADRAASELKTTPVSWATVLKQAL